MTYVWSPDSKKIAYMTGAEGESDRTKSKGIFIYDIATREKKKIAESGLSIEWLLNGDLLLYRAQIEQRGEERTRIYKSTIYSGAGIITSEKKGINFSLDGRYSVNPRYIGRSEDIRDGEILVDFFDLKEGTTILGSSADKIFAKGARILWRPILWLKGNRFVVEREIKNSLDWGISICDFENNKILKEVKGRIVGVNSDRSKLVIYSDGKFSAIDVP